MILALHTYKTLRVALMMILVLLIGFKTAIPIVKGLSKSAKQVFVLNEKADNEDGEKKQDRGPSIEKEKEFTHYNNSIVSHTIWFTAVVHLTRYHNHYQSDYYYQITTPPPDLYLQSIA